VDKGFSSIKLQGHRDLLEPGSGTERTDNGLVSEPLMRTLVHVDASSRRKSSQRGRRLTTSQILFYVPVLRMLPYLCSIFAPAAAGMKSGLIKLHRT
jgi:hypothetical protein